MSIGFITRTRILTDMAGEPLTDCDLYTLQHATEDAIYKLGVEIDTSYQKNENIIGISYAYSTVYHPNRVNWRHRPLVVRAITITFTYRKVDALPAETVEADRPRECRPYTGFEGERYHWLENLSGDGMLYIGEWSKEQWLLPHGDGPVAPATMHKNRWRWRGAVAGPNLAEPETTHDRYMS